MSSYARQTSHLQLLLVLLLPSLFVGAHAIKHDCYYDQIMSTSSESKVVRELPHPNASSSLTFTAVSEDVWEPIRIGVSTKDFDNPSQYCQSQGDATFDFAGSRIACGSGDVFTATHRKDLNRIIHSAIRMHSTRLRVQPIKYGFRVPKFRSKFCSRFTVPPIHQKNGVKDTDMVLYVSPGASSVNDIFAVAMSCVVLASTGRPVVGVIMFDTKNIAATEYHVRVAAHEVAHVLGFDYEMMVKYSLVNRETGRRGKTQITEIAGKTLLSKVKEHFDCDSSMGMELEDEGIWSTKPLHRSLWEARNAKDELMAGIVRKGYYTYFTLALFHDYGFYKADFSKAEHMEWGYKSGCTFLTKKCIEDDKSIFPTMFCTETNASKLSCSPDGRTMVHCYGIKTNTVGFIPEHFNYFSDSSLSGYSNMLTDRCPFIEQSETVDCQGSTSNTNYGKYGENSWCLTQKTGDTFKLQDGQNGVCAEMHNENNVLSFTFSSDGERQICNTETNIVTAGKPLEGAQFHCPMKELIKTSKSAKSESILLDDASVSSIAEVAEAEVSQTTHTDLTEEIDESLLRGLSQTPLLKDEHDYTVVHINEESDPKPSTDGGTGERHIPRDDQMVNKRGNKRSVKETNEFTERKSSHTGTKRNGGEEQKYKENVNLDGKEREFNVENEDTLAENRQNTKEERIRQNSNTHGKRISSKDSSFFLSHRYCVNCLTFAIFVLLCAFYTMY